MGSTFQPDVALSESARLNSDQVNYVIWRCVVLIALSSVALSLSLPRELFIHTDEPQDIFKNQVGCYGEAAVKLQRDWKQDPQSLPLAKNIKNGALIRLIKYGLRYYYTDQTWDRRARRKIPLRSSMLFFGEESARPSLQKHEDDADETETAPENQRGSPPEGNNRKHPREGGPNGVAHQAGGQSDQPASKRTRKNGAPHHPDRQHEQQSPQRIVPRQQTAEMTSTILEDLSAMEIEQKADSARSAAPEAKSPPCGSDPDQDTDVDMRVGNGVAQALEISSRPLSGAGQVIEAQEQERIIEASPPIATLDRGLSVGMQFAPAKTPDLASRSTSESTILHVADYVHVTSASWHPTDPSVLAVSGQDYVSMWKKFANQSPPPATTLTPFHSIVDRQDEAMVSAMAWEPGGSMLAIAVFDHHTTGTIRIYDGEEPHLIENLPAAQRLITSLRWQKVGSRLLGFAASSAESSLVLWDLSGSAPSPGVFSVTLQGQINDIDWSSHGNTNMVCAAGDGVVYCCRTAPDLAIKHRWLSDPADHANWTLVRCSWWSEEISVIIVASSHPASLWMPARDIYARDIHNAPLTCLELRPVSMVYPDQDLACHFATSSLDGTVKMWRYSDRSASIECLFKLCMVESSPILALSYIPDGSGIAAASYEKVTLWSTEKRGPPLGKWEGSDDTWAGTNLRRQRRVSQGETMSEDGVREEVEHSLSWDAESKNLAFALGNQVAIIDFKR